MQRHYHNKLRKFLEDFSGKFLLLDLEKPGSAKVRMLGAPRMYSQFLENFSIIFRFSVTFQSCGMNTFF